MPNICPYRPYLLHLCSGHRNVSSSSVRHNPYHRSHGNKNTIKSPRKLLYKNVKNLRAGITNFLLYLVLKYFPHIWRPFKCYVTQWKHSWGGGGVKFAEKKPYEDVGFNVISVTRGGWVSMFQKKVLSNTRIAPFLCLGSSDITSLFPSDSQYLLYDESNNSIGFTI